MADKITPARASSKPATPPRTVGASAAQMRCRMEPTMGWQAVVANANNSGFFEPYRSPARFVNVVPEFHAPHYRRSLTRGRNPGWVQKNGHYPRLESCPIPNFLEARSTRCRTTSDRPSSRAPRSPNFGWGLLHWRGMSGFARSPRRSNPRPGRVESWWASTKCREACAARAAGLDARTAERRLAISIASSLPPRERGHPPEYQI